MKYLILTCAICMSFVCSYGQTYYYYKGTGNINTTTNWGTTIFGGGTAPLNFTDPNQIFNIRNTTSVALSAANWTIRGINSQLVVNSGVTFTVNSGRTLTIGAAGENTKFVTNAAAITQNNGTISMNASATLQLDNGCTYVHNSSNGTSIFGGTESFGVTSTFKVTNWDVNEPLCDFNANINASVSWSGNNYYFGNLELAWTNAGVWNQKWFNNTIYFVANDLTISSAFSGSTFQFTLLNNGTTHAYCGRHFIMQAGTLNMHDGTNGVAYLHVNGNISQTGGTITKTGTGTTYGNIVGWHTITPVTWSFTGGTRSYMRYSVDPSKTVQLTSDLAMGSGLTDIPVMTVSAGAVLDAQGYTMSYGTAGVTGSYVSVYGTLQTSHSNGLWTTGQTARTVSSASNLKVRAETGGTIEYYGSNGQFISSLSGISSPYNDYATLKISGGNTKQLEGNTLVNTAFDFTGSANYLNIQNYTLEMNSSAATISNASSSSYFIVGSGTGRLRQDALTSGVARAYPIGTATYYLPATFTPSAGSTDFSAGVYTGVDPTITPYMFSVNIVDAFWTVDRNSGSANLSSVRFDWQSALEGSNFAAAPDPSINSYESTIATPTDASTWALLVANARDNTNNYYIGSNVTSFGMKFVIGAGAPALILPLQLTSFNAKRISNYNQLNWTMENVDGVDHFEVERSINSTNFIKVGNVDATASSKYNYQDNIDNNITYYYRIKAVAGSGNAKYSHVISIGARGSSAVSLVLNFVSDQLVLQHPAAKQAAYAIYTTDGKLLKSGRIVSNSMISNVSIGQLPSGYYLIRYTDGDVKATEKFIKH